MRTRRGDTNSHIVDVHVRASNEDTAQRRCCMQQVVQLSSTARMHTPRGGANSHIVDVHFMASTEALHRGGVACSMQVVQLSSTACTAALFVTTECTPVKLAWEQSSLQLAIVSVSLPVARLPSKVAVNHRLRSQCALNVVACKQAHRAATVALKWER